MFAARYSPGKKNLVLEDVPKLSPKANEVILEIRAAAGKVRSRVPLLPKAA